MLYYHPNKAKQGGGDLEAAMMHRPVEEGTFRVQKLCITLNAPLHPGQFA